MTNVQYARFNILPGSIARFLSLPSSLLSFIALLPVSAAGQTTTATSSVTPEMTPTIPLSHSRIEHTRSTTVSFISSTISNSTTAAATSTSTPISNDVFPETSHTEDANTGAFKYYWLILALFGVGVALFLWWINRRRIRRKEQMRLSGQNALARDMEGWINTRRWYQSAWTPNQTRAFIRREEGLNEHGEAPPPYRPKGDVTVAQDPVTGLSIPLRTLSREQVDAGRPPEYRETDNEDNDDTIRPNTTDSRIDRPGIADSPPGSSIRDLIQDHDRQGTLREP